VVIIDTRALRAETVVALVTGRWHAPTSRPQLRIL